LVIDDEPAARELLSDILTAFRFDVTTASSVEEALRIVKAHRPDVVISDIGMPGEDGYAFIRKLRALAVGEGGNIPAVALTAYARSEDRNKALVAGFNMHVPKPVEPAELLAVLVSLATSFRAA
jgi:CheY-like chemotaxis protein